MPDRELIIAGEALPIAAHSLPRCGAALPALSSSPALSHSSGKWSAVLSGIVQGGRLPPMPDNLPLDDIRDIVCDPAGIPEIVTRDGARYFVTVLGWSRIRTEIACRAADRGLLAAAVQAGRLKDAEAIAVSADPLIALRAHQIWATAGGSWRACPCPPCRRTREESL